MSFMAKKKFSIHLSYDSPVMLTFLVVTVLFYIIDEFITKGKIRETVLVAPTAAGGQFPFSFKDFLSYLRLFLHVFGAREWNSLFLCMTYILLLGPQIEGYYGSVMVLVMTAVATLLSGVLSACFCREINTGAASVMFMLLLLNCTVSVYKKKLPVASAAALALFVFSMFTSGYGNGAVCAAVNVAGGICGFLPSFLGSTGGRTPRSSSSGGRKKAGSPDEKAADPVVQSDETVVGTLSF